MGKEELGPLVPVHEHDRRARSLVEVVHAVVRRGEEPALHSCDVHEFLDCGHFLAEEAPDEIAALMRTFMSDSERPAT